ncbi:molecular chaperone DnaJ [Vibrio alfacsensis]|uniref:DnaJ C-terminal domain-containing protein n=1 Tax=Vibrio alfacsensis TaxID=1074311 RepID=UPI001BF18415|nr:DnaJ C-terminal domain-containing protein [Vibrio alfacsensis]BBM67226.1 molecular chaperone DnaJ [Vibrio alfacsensis]
MSKRDYYEVLGIPKDTSTKDIKKAYKKLAMKYHPDRNPGDKTAEEKFKEIKEAYEILTDDEKRQQYDRFGHAAFQGASGNGHHDGRGHYQSGGFEDIFGGAFGRQGFGGFGRSSSGGFGGFDDIFSQARGGRSQPSKGQDHEFTLTVDFVDAIQGAEKVVELPVNGEQKKINVKIPPGIRDGEKIRFSNKGAPGINGGPNGDLLLVINTRAHAFLKREQDNLLCTAHIDIANAALGGEVEVQVLDSRYKLKVPAGSQSGRKFKMTGKGVKNRKGVTGDLIVTLHVDTPTNLTDKQKDLLEQFKATL